MVLTILRDLLTVLIMKDMKTLERIEVSLETMANVHLLQQTTSLEAIGDHSHIFSTSDDVNNAFVAKDKASQMVNTSRY